MDGTEMPIGLLMQLGMHPEAMDRFSSMTEEEKSAVVEQARNVNSKNEMRALVEGIGKGMESSF